MNKIDRNNVNDSKVNAQDFPKSGFDMSYKSRLDFVLGRLIPSAYQHIMPADKFSGSNDVKYTFNTLQVPEISDVEVGQYNFYVPYRSIDKTFIDGIVPTELNGMSSSWHTPTFDIGHLVSIFLNTVTLFDDYTINDLFSALVFDPEGEGTSETWSSGTADTIYNSLLAHSSNFDNLYFADVWKDYCEFVRQHLQGITQQLVENDVLEFSAIYFTAFLQPLFGRNSLLDLLGYQYLRSYDIRKISENIANFGIVNGNFDDYLDYSTLTNEYALRAYYAVWYEWYRDPNLEKRSNNLPDWRQFGSSSIFVDWQSIFFFLMVRPRSWAKDMFTGAMPDDISRHVYAPIWNGEGTLHNIADDIYNYQNAEADMSPTGMAGSGFVNLKTVNLQYLDPTTGTKKNITVPLPKAVNDSIIALSGSLSVPTIGLDLRDLRKSQMLERYLKRNFYFGDEYQDRMLAHYGSKVSDNSIRRPHLLSSSVSSVNPRQEIASISTSEMQAGTRTATAQDSAHGDAYEFFAEEFGIVISITSIRPIAQYSGMCPQNLLYLQTDFPLPEFANNNDEFGRNNEIAFTARVARQGLSGDFQQYCFGHYPYAHAYRSRVDEVHGSFLDDRIDYTFARFFGADASDTTPKLNYQFIHCRPRLGMFADTLLLGGQGYMTCDNHFFVERVLPTPVEEI